MFIYLRLEICFLYSNSFIEKSVMQEACRMIGGILAEPRTQGLNMFLANYIHQNGGKALSTKLRI